jgi:hypothetical protein
VPQQVNLTDSWTGIRYHIALRADRDVNGKLVVANLVVTRAGSKRNLASKPRLHGLQPDGFAALDLAKGREGAAYWDRHISITKDDVLVVRVDDAQVRPIPGAQSGEVGSVEIASLRLHVSLDTPSPPLPVPRAFVSEQYGLTFNTPSGGFYCALPADWTGSDHGTVIFLAAPKKCFDAGYPSSARGFDGNAPRVEVFYAYYDGDDDETLKPPPCNTVGRVKFLGIISRLCQKSSLHDDQVSVSAKYSADGPAQTTLTLITPHTRLANDLRRFKKLLESARTCSATWQNGKDGKSFTTGSGPPCPAGARWF